MIQEESKMIGFACSYTPLALIEAAGFAPYRILPTGDSPDQAGQLLHDNLCPHIKRILDRALHDDLPELAGMVFVSSCDAMRRLADAWPRVRPEHRVILIDLPVTVSDITVSFFAGELSRLADALSGWSGNAITRDRIEESIERHNELASLIDCLQKRAGCGKLEGGSAGMQALFNRAATEPVEQTLSILRQLAAEPESPSPLNDGVPIFLFGNVLPDPEAFSLFESCGVRIAGEDLCTGSRLFSPIEAEASGGVLVRLARGLLTGPRCARTFEPSRPGKIAEDVLARAKSCNARGVICHTVKFCDPYLARLPTVRGTLREASLPMLLLEGDCTMRSIGQQRTRIEAFVEMLR